MSKSFLDTFKDKGDLFDEEYDGYEHGTDVHVAYGTKISEVVTQKHIALTSEAPDSDEDDYSEAEDYPSDTNYHRFPIETVKNLMPPEQYNIISEALTFEHGPAPTNEENVYMNGSCHQKKSYKVIIRVPPEVFPSEVDLIHWEWQKCPNLLKASRIPNFSFFILLYLGTISRIVRKYQPALITSSKRWWRPVQRSEKFQLLEFDVQFTGLTTKKLKDMPFRLYAQLQVTSNINPSQFRLLCQGWSMPFAIYSHSRQYGYTPPDQCALCKKPKTRVVGTSSTSTSSSSTPEGFKKKDGSRKFYLSKGVHRYPAWRDKNHQKQCEEVENVYMQPEEIKNDVLKLLGIFPIEVLPGDDISVIVFGTKNVNKLFIRLDGEQSIVEFTRFHHASNVFVGKSPVLFSPADYMDEQGKKKFFIRKIGYSHPYDEEEKEEMFEIPESDTTFFLYKTLEDIAPFLPCQ